MNLRHCDLTNYPRIYGETYWGGFKSDVNSKFANPEIINNRNRFITDHNIVKSVTYCRTEPKFIYNLVDVNIHYYLDHVERYRMANGDYILISSPYTDNYDKEHIENGWTKIYPLYSSGKTDSTFMKITNFKIYRENLRRKK
jgi:hypothetical protein